MSEEENLPQSGEGKIIGGNFRVHGAISAQMGYGMLTCVDERSQQPVDIRLIPISDLERSGSVLRLQRDLKNAGTLTHKNVLRVIGYGKESDEVFVVEEYVKGLSLSHLMSRREESQRPFELKEAFYLTIHICNALAYAWDTMAHGFLMPSHIKMRPDGRAKVGGFGLAAHAEVLHPETQMSKWDRACLKFQFTEPSARDLYALGRIFYALLKNSVNVSLSFEEQVESDDELSTGLTRLLLRCAGSPDVEPLQGPSEFREELHFIVSEMFDRMVPLKSSSTDSVGPPPMPSEAFLDTVAKPAGIELGSESGFGSSSDMMAELRWMYRVGTSEFGPVSGAQLADKLNRGELSGYAEVRDIQKKRFRPLAETPTFTHVFEEWMNQADAREERLAEERASASSKKLSRRLKLAGLVVVSMAAIVFGLDALIAAMQPAPKAMEIGSLVSYQPPKIEVPERIEHDPGFKKKLDEYKALMARQPKRRLRTKGGDAIFQSVIDFSNSAGSQGQIEEEMTRRLYSSLSQHRGLLTCLQAALPDGVQTRSFNVRVTVLPNGSLTEISIPGGGMTVSACAKKVLRSYRVRSIKGVTVSATLPFTVQR